MKNAIFYGIGNAIIGLLIGILGENGAADSYEIFIWMTPLSAFLTGLIIWKIMVGKDNFLKKSTVIFTGLSTGVIYLVLSFILSIIYLNLCYSLTGNCTFSSGEAPEGVFNMLPSALFFGFYALLWYGLISVIGAIVTGLLIRKLKYSN